MKNNVFNVLSTEEGLLVVVAMYFYAIYNQVKLCLELKHKSYDYL